MSLNSVILDRYRITLENCSFGNDCYVSLTPDKVKEGPAVLSGVLQYLMEELQKLWLMKS